MMKRRTQLLPCFLGLILSTLTIQESDAAHRGKVFIDRNANGLQEKDEKGVKGVAVSDGLNVVLTDAEGYFELPGHSKERFIFITTPSGYKTNNTYYQRIEADKTSYEFGLLLHNGTITKDGAHSFIQISDTEIFNTQGHEDWVGNLRDYAANEKVSFIIHTGDICYENGLKEHIRLMNTKNMNCPVFYGIGNHDLVKGNYGEELFESIYGPVFYSFDVGNVHYVMTPMRHGDYKPSYTVEDVYRWLKNDLALVPAGKPVILFNHDLLSYDDTFRYGINETESIDFTQHNLKATLYGHWHINFMRKQGSFYTIGTATLDKGGIDHSTSAFRVLDIDKGGNISSNLRYTYINNHLAIPSLQNGWAPSLANGNIPLSVNAYSSASPVKQVTYSYENNQKIIGKNLPLKANTDWNWYGEIPTGKFREGDLITIQVKATLNNGESFTHQEKFTWYPEQQLRVNVPTDWNNLLGNATHTGYSPDTLAFPMKLAWVQNVKGNIFMSSPIIYQGKIYVATVDENLKGEGGVCALDPASGKIEWRYQTRNSIKNTIIAGEGAILAQDAEGYLYALNATNGQLLWEKKLEINGLPALIEGLVEKDGMVYAGTGSGLCAVNIRTGKTIWTNTEWKQAEGTTSTWSLDQNVLVTGSQWRGLYAQDATTGKLLWRATKNGLSDRGATPAIHGNQLYVISRKSLFIMDLHTGKIIVRKELPHSVDATSTPLVTDKEIIFGTVSSGILALDNETLEEKWNYRTEDALIYTAPYTRKPNATIESSPLWIGDMVVIGASDGCLYGLNKASGTLVWKHTTGAPIFGTPAVSGKTLVVVDFSGNVYAFVAQFVKDIEQTTINS